MAPAVYAEDKAIDAVSCAKCETVWVRAPLAGQKAKGYTRKGKMVCPDCVTAVQNVFAGGKLEHACATCGDLEACVIEQERVNSVEKKDRAATCSKCEITWTRTPHKIGKINTYRTKSSMSCKDCETAAKQYLESGEWASACGACGDRLAACH